MSEEERNQFYRDQLRSARAAALADTEGFEEVIHVLELIGRQKSNKIKKGLKSYEKELAELAKGSLLSSCIAQKISAFHTPFKELFKELVNARNDAVHQGAHARILTDHAVDITLILEDAIMSGYSKVSQYMVRGVVIAEPWHPISYVRQQMLKHSFSHLPVFVESWKLISESAMAKYLRGQPNGERSKRLVRQVKDASGLLVDAETKSPDEELSGVLQCIDDRPILIVNGNQKNQLVGILCASDVM